MHKSPSQPPRRPIVSGIGSLTDNASKFVDSFLLPHVLGLPSHIRDTSDLLRHIEGIQVPRDSLLVAIDVESLYSSIPHKKRVVTARLFLMEQEHTSWPLNKFILQLLTYILTRNFFIFEDQHYLQIQGSQWAHPVPHHMLICSLELGRDLSFLMTSFHPL